MGTIFKVRLKPGAGSGTITVAALGDSVHNSFDNITWSAPWRFMVAEDRGDGLHEQLNTLDSVWQYQLSQPDAPQRVIALGRDVQSLGGGEDNEPTGLYVSNGSSSLADMYGTTGSLVGARGFVTEQHGMNQTFEIVHNFAEQTRRGVPPAQGRDARGTGGYLRL